MAFGEDWQYLQYSKPATYIIFMIIAAILYSIAFWGILSYYNPSDDWLYCSRSLPDHNTTGTRAEICYTTYWAKYCKMTYPRYCPDHIQKKPSLNYINLSF